MKNMKGIVDLNQSLALDTGLLQVVTFIIILQPCYMFAHTL